MSRNFPPDTNTVVEVECWVIAGARAQLQFCERIRRDRECFYTLWFGSGLSEGWPHCKEEMTPEDHPECWFLPAPSSQLEPPKLG